jgi:hypothetical protein
MTDKSGNSIKIGDVCRCSRCPEKHPDSKFHSCIVTILYFVDIPGAVRQVKVTNRYGKDNSYHCCVDKDYLRKLSTEELLEI